MNDVLIHYDELSDVNDALKNIIKEFTDVEDRENVLESAIGRPFGKSDLRDKADDFEDGWKHHRKKLLGEIEKVQKHVDGVLTGFQKWDQKTASKMKTDHATTGHGNRPR